MRKIERREEGDERREERRVRQRRQNDERLLLESAEDQGVSQQRRLGDLLVAFVRVRAVLGSTLV